MFAHGFVSPCNSPYFCKPLPQQLWADVCLQQLYLLAWLSTPWRATKPRCCKVTTPEAAARGRVFLPRGGLFHPPGRSWEASESLKISCYLLVMNAQGSPCLQGVRTEGIWRPGGAVTYSGLATCSPQLEMQTRAAGGGCSCCQVG